MSIIKAQYEGPLSLGEFKNIYCLTVVKGGVARRYVTIDAFREIVGISGAAEALRASLISLITRETHAGNRRVTELLDALKSPVTIQGNTALHKAFEHTIITKYARAVLDARRLGLIGGSTALEYADNCERFLAASADVGWAALIDEATGYIKQHQLNEYRELFREFLREESRAWEREFPDKFFDGIYRIYGLVRKPDTNHPQFFARFIRKYIYYPLADSKGAILSELEAKNPIMDQRTGRKFRFHQFLTDQVGLPALRAHIWQVTGILGSSMSKQRFQLAFRTAFPRANDQMDIDLDDI